MCPETAGRASIKLPQVIFVTGKGGTGKSTVAAALARALAQRRATTLVELEPRDGAAAKTTSSAMPTGAGYELRQLSAREELRDFIERLVPMRAISRRMLQSRTFGLVTAALPGLEAFLLLERILQIAQDDGGHRSVVVDAAATGGALEMLSVAEGVERLAPFGTLNRLARDVGGFLRDCERFGVMLTLRPEELALREALEAAPALTALGIRCFGAVVNGAVSALFSAEDLARPLHRLAGHRRLAKRRYEMAAAVVRAKRELSRAGLEVITMPTVFSVAFGPAELEILATGLERSGIV
jgi:hypothetical protein